MITRPNSRKTVRRSIAHNVNLSQRRAWYTDTPVGEPPALPVPVIPPTANDDDKPTLSQKHVDKLMGNTRKETEDKTTKRLLEQFGIDSNDPKALETVKALIASAKDAEKAKMTAEEKTAARITELEKERDDAKALADKAQLERQIDKRNDAIKEAFSDPKLNCKQPLKLLKLVMIDHPAEVEAVMNEGKLDAVAIKALVELGRKENPEYFTGGTPGSVSNAGGRASLMDDPAGLNRVKIKSQQILRG